MADLILRPNGFTVGRPYAFQIRKHESLGEVEYTTICYVSEALAREIVATGQAYWLFGEPKALANEQNARPTEETK